MDEQGMAWGAAPPGASHSWSPPPFEIEHQIIRVRFDHDQRAVNASTEIRVRSVGRAPLDTIELDAVGLAIASVRDGSDRVLARRQLTDTLSVTLADPLQPGASATIHIAYSVVRPPAGVYFVDTPRVVWTQGRLEDNRFWMPTVSGASVRTTWDLFITTNPDERSFTTGRLAGSRAVADGMEWHWVQDWAVPLQYLALGVGPYEPIDDSVGEVTIQSWAYRDVLTLAREKFSVTPRVIDIMQRKLNVPLPGRHVTQAVVPGFIFWSWLGQWRPLIATSVEDDQLILGDQRGWPGEEREMVIARLVAQEWFGKSLAPRDWSELWLSDGFINFMAQIYYEEAHGVDAVAPIREWSGVSVFGSDRDDRRPLVYDRWVYGPMELLLTEHAGQKGAVVLQMLRHELGDSVFWQGMHDYVTTYAGQSVTTTAFQAVMEKASGRDLGLFFRQWVTGGGFPFLNIAYVYEPAAHRVTLTIRQVQQRDDLTGFFDAPVDVIVGTEQEVMHATVPLHGAVTTHSMTVPGDPLYVQWDPGKWLQSDVQFPRPVPLLRGQLEHGSLYGRIEALQGLAEHARGLFGREWSIGFMGTNVPPVADTEALHLILRVARSDASLAMRAHAMQSMMGIFDDGARAALIEFTHDTSPEIRAVAAHMLFGLHYPDSLTRLSELAEGDPNQEVRSTAAQMLSMMGEREPQQRIADSIMRSPTASDADRASAAATLADNSMPDAWEVGKRYLTAPSSSRAVRQAVMRQMGITVRHREANAGEFIALLRPCLASDDPTNRLAAVRECSSTKIPPARAALEERKQVEVDARVLRAIDESLSEMAKERFRPPEL
jgi:aminopeptidase N